MASKLSTYDTNLLTDEQKKKIASFKEAYETAQKSGDISGMTSAHQAAERVRADAGYSGGSDGGSYTPLNSENGYSASLLPSYKAQIQAVNDLYDSAVKTQKDELTSAYNTNVATLEGSRDSIGKTYQTQKNDLAAQSEKARQSFNESASASGINSGAGSQAELSMNNTYQGNMNSLRASEAQAQTDLDSQINVLKLQYQSAIEQAESQGAYERANGLLEEYRKQAQSAVSVAADQADENYRAYTANYNKSQDEYTKNQNEAETIASDVSTNYNKAVSRASTMAKYGDFSGYAALGYTGEQIARMEQIWRYQNPELAQLIGATS